MKPRSRALRLVVLAPAALLASACASAEPTPAASPPPVTERRAEVPRGEVGASTKVRLDRQVVPVAYDLHLVVDPRSARFSGAVTIDVQVAAPTADFVLHGRDLTVREVFVEAGGRRIAATATPRAAFGARESVGELVVQTREPVAAGRARLVFTYDAPFATLTGLYRASAGDDTFAFTQMEPIDARRAFPSFDDPSLKATFAVKLTVPRGVEARSNGRPLGRVAGPEGDTVTFATTPPIPSYLVAFAVGPLEHVGDDDFGLIAQRGRARLGAESLEASRKILADQAAYTGIPYAYGKLDLAAVPNFGPGAMENAGLVTFRDELLLLGADPPAELRRRMRGIVAHELAHQWFGDLVTMRWWDDLWLNEAFATWMGPKTCDSVYPGMNAVDDRVLYEARAVEGDMLPSSRAVRPTIATEDAIHEAGGWSAYLKGSVVLAMVERYVGPDRFRAGLHDYLSRHAHGNAEITDLTEALQKAAPDTQAGKVLAAFVSQPGVPMVQATVTCDAQKRSGRVDVQIGELVARGAEGAPSKGGAAPAARSWPVPVCLRVEGATTPACQVIEGKGAIALDACPTWVHPDAGEIGYYRWKLDPASRASLLRATSKLSPTERAGLVLDTWSLVLAGEASLVEVVEVLRALDLRRDEPRVVVEAVANTLREIDRIFVTDATRAEFRKLVHATLDPVAIPVPKLPRTTQGDEERLLRVAVLGALVDLTDDAASLKKLDDAKKAANDADLAALDLRVSARRGDPRVKALSTERGLLEATRDKPPFERVAALGAMGSFKDEATLRAALDTTLLPSFQPGDFIHVRRGAMRQPEGRAVFFAWMTEHFDALVAKLGGGGSLPAVLSGVCDEGELARLESFFAGRIASIEGGQRNFDEGRLDARRCIRLRAQGAPELKRALATPAK